MDITFTLQSITDGSLITGATGITVYISKDGGSFTAATNAAAEVGRGLYKVTLTSTEAEFTTLYYQPVCTGAQTNTYAIDAPVTMPTVPSASDNATAVWGATTRTVTNTIPSTSDITTAVWAANARTLTASPTDISGLATSSALSAVATNVTAVKAKTDNLPSSPAAVGSAMTLTAAYDAAKTASQFNAATDSVNVASASVTAIQSGLSTFNASTDSVTINSTQAATFGTSTAQTSILVLLEALYSGLYHWEVQNNTLTIYDDSDVAIDAFTLTKDANGNIIAVTPEDYQG